VHEGQFGGRCEQCHISDSWKKLKARVGAVSVPSGARAVSDKALQSPQRRFYA
jgi:hypothetical protein